MGIYAIKPRFQATLRPLVRLLRRWQVPPDWLTGGGVVTSGAMAGALLLAAGDMRWLWGVVAGAPLRLTLNALDGEVARGRGLAGPWGEAKNEAADRLADALIFGALLLVPPVPIVLALVALLVTLGCGIVGILGRATGGTRRYEGPMGKGDRMLLLAAAGGAGAVAHSWWPLTLALVVIVGLGGCTIWQRLEAIRGNP